MNNLTLDLQINASKIKKAKETCLLTSDAQIRKDKITQLLVDEALDTHLKNEDTDKLVQWIELLNDEKYIREMASKVIDTKHAVPIGIKIKELGYGHLIDELLGPAVSDFVMYFTTHYMSFCPASADGAIMYPHKYENHDWLQLENDASDDDPKGLFKVERV